MTIFVQVKREFTYDSTTKIYIDRFYTFRRPKAPAFLFMTPLASNWTNLKSIVPNVLQLSVIGYPFINPGPVGGTPFQDHESDPTAGIEPESPPP